MGDGCRFQPLIFQGVSGGVFSMVFFFTSSTTEGGLGRFEDGMQINDQFDFWGQMAQGQDDKSIPIGSIYGIFTYI